ncbi:branched-chain amino acid ABC transporter permease [Compostimonas suwonensis]|uniref:Branched-chain amino acid transport system permease protein n=1 Tax=Compostimonas suwonensis TaxID=1048394 RepID=A0A2M9BV80_9MICO|nr:branched-chain amino acid ABC transporter permease [Compostimonas suwonensis]PJJ61855.1 branched-chain amino acid transport system permease protein [Compostimonas suwonensis]
MSITEKAHRRSSRSLKALFGVLFATIVLGVTLAGGMSPATAAETPTPAPAPTEESDFTNTYSIGGVLRNGDEVLEGVDITVEGDGFSETATSDEAGEWEVVVPGKAEYTVTLEVSTLPDGVELRNPDAASSVVTADQWLTTSITRSFPMGEDTRETTGFGAQLLQRLVSGLNFGLLIALAAIGITLIFGTTGLNNFAHGEMVTFGAIVAWIFAVLLGVNIFVAMAIALVFGGAFGWVQDALLWKPLRRKGVKLVQAMIVSIGLAIVLRYLYLYFIGGETKAMNVGLSEAVQLGPVRITVASIISMVISVVVLVLVGLFLTRTRIGKATRAVSDNPSLAAASGIDVDRIIRIVWVIAGALAALAGVMLALYRQVSWDMGFQILLLMFAAVTLGGLGSAYGALVGSIVVGLFVELSTLFIPADLKYAAALVVLILVLLVRPQGILGRRERIG